MGSGSSITTAARERFPALQKTGQYAFFVSECAPAGAALPGWQNFPPRDFSGRKVPEVQGHEPGRTGMVKFYPGAN